MGGNHLAFLLAFVAALQLLAPAESLAGRGDDCVSQFAQMSGDELEALVAGVVTRSRDKDLFDLRTKMLRQKSAVSVVERWNAELILALTAPLPGTPQRLPSMSRLEADDLYRYLSCHPVAGMKHIRKYDPQGNFGFCFGRATAVHLEALRRGLARPRIMKIWGVGPMKGGWGHHVATLIAAKEGGWWAIDPEIGKVVSGVEWVRWLKAEQENAASPLVFFVSEAERFGPSPGKYTATDLYGSGTDDIYNGYFRDLIEEAPRPKREAP